MLEEKVDFDFITRLAANVSNQFGISCEVAVHKFDEKNNLVITQIENGHVTGRKVGDISTNEFLEEFSEKDFMKNSVYRMKSSAGKDLLSSTTFFSEDGEIKGFVCIKYDISDVLSLLGRVPLLLEKTNNPDINDVLEFHLKEAERLFGKPFSSMSKDEKYNVVEYLEKKHAFLISKSSIRVCEALNITKYCLYSFLKEIRGT